jgi:hypothetical protein
MTPTKEAEKAPKFVRCKFLKSILVQVAKGEPAKEFLAGSEGLIPEEEAG